ncbi:ferredoxin [Acuticoccus sediminis]|uniref:Ferredoxin n=1 Tax=Acuticoccus sediminis TaxID=2184697 RepID=A0A8B2P326_9HYPH|nr:ferredoxin [Acuticoccus sediminis]
MTSTSDESEDWRPVATVGDTPGPSIQRIKIDGYDLVLVRTDGGVHAAQGSCPHERADLGKARLEGCRLVCPRHLASFDLRTGAPSRGWKVADLKLYPARIAGERVEIDLAAVRRNPPMGQKAVWDFTGGAG